MANKLATLVFGSEHYDPLVATNVPIGFIVGIACLALLKYFGSSAKDRVEQLPIQIAQLEAKVRSGNFTHQDIHQLSMAYRSLDSYTTTRGGIPRHLIKIPLYLGACLPLLSFYFIYEERMSARRRRDANRTT